MKDPAPWSKQVFQSGNHSFSQ